MEHTCHTEGAEGTVPKSVGWAASDHGVRTPNKYNTCCNHIEYIMFRAKARFDRPRKKRKSTTGDNLDGGRGFDTAPAPTRDEKKSRDPFLG